MIQSLVIFPRVAENFSPEESMGLFSNMTLNTLDDLFVVQLHDLYDAEQRLTKALPKMAEAASNNKLRWAFKNHLEETKQHVARLEKAFDTLGLAAKTRNLRSHERTDRRG